MNAGRVRDERGAGTVLVVLAIALVAMTAFVSAVVGSLVVAREQVAAAADQAALSAARAHRAGQDACAVAAEVADRNGGELIHCQVDADQDAFVVTVTVATVPRAHWPGLPDRVAVTAHAGNT